MAKIHGVAGEWARVNGTVIGLWPLFLGVFGTGVAVPLIWISALWGGMLLVASLVFVLWSLVVGLRRVERFFKGARGEERVCSILQKLPDAYHVFNDFTVGRKHVDHVVAGPGGVFAIETKFWKGKVTVEDERILLDGQLPDRSPLKQAIQEATLVKTALKKAGWDGPVTPVLVFASNTFAVHRAYLKGTAVLNAEELLESFGSSRVTIPPAELDRLISVMDSIS